MAEERMEVDEEEEFVEVEVKTDSKTATARDGSKATGRQFFQMRSSKGTPSSGQEKGSMEKPEMAPEVSKNANVKEEKPEMAEKKKRKKRRNQKLRALTHPRGVTMMRQVAHQAHHRLNHLQQRLFQPLKARDGATMVF